jgi:NADPH2:quinone reductase
MRAIRIERTGGPEVMALVEIETPAPKAGEILVRHRAIGVNFIDTYHRSGLYRIPIPGGLGSEGAGVVEAVGEGVGDFAVGDRVGYASGPLGAYGECNAVRAATALKLPDAIGFDIAAAAMLKGMTARYLLKRTYPVKAGETIVVHAAAGGVGQIMVQWAVALGARVIACAGSDEKCALAKTLGAAETINTSRDDIAKTIRALTNGEGAPVVYDPVGKDTFEATLKSLAPLGMFVSFGNASGPPPAVEPQALAANGSLFFTRPTMVTYVRTPALLRETADDLWAVIASGKVKIAPPTAYKLADAQQAHRDLEARRTTGSLVLTP